MKKGKSRNKRKKTRSRLLWIAIAVIGIAAVISAVCVAGMLATKENAWRTPEELLVEYMDYIPKQEYEEMYAMACIYSAFCNEGNVIKPYLVYQKDAVAEYWIPGAFSNETASRVLEGTKKVVNDSNGTGYAAHRDDILLAGKTGTAEIKASKDDTSGTELGWFAIFTAEDTVERPILIISMVEDVKGRGGSGYVVKKDNLVLEEWFGSN